MLGALVLCAEAPKVEKNKCSDGARDLQKWSRFLPKELWAWAYIRLAHHHGYNYRTFGIVTILVDCIIHAVLQGIASKSFPMI